jgi:hypothetical protein
MTDWSEVRNHEMGKSRVKCSHAELVEHLLRVAYAFRKMPDKAKGVTERASMVARQRPEDCEVCNPMGGGKSHCEGCGKEGVDA